MTWTAFILFGVGCLLVYLGLVYGAPRLGAWVWRKFFGPKLVFICLFLAATVFASEATLRIEQRGNDVILYVTGGTSNVQYQVWTPAFHNPADTTSWYYWRRIYSRDFLSNPGHGEVLVFGTNTSQQPRSFFQIRGVLPDASLKLEKL